MSRGRDVLSTDELARRAAGGDRRCRLLLHRRLRGQVHRFAFTLVGDAAVAGHLTRAAVDEALRRPGPGFTATTLRVVRRLARGHDLATTADSYAVALERMVLLLLDDDGLSAGEAAEILALPAAEVEALHAAGRRRLGASDDGSRCCGWALVRRWDELTPGERAAAERHLALCRRCTVAHEGRLAARAALRRLIPAGGVAAGGGVAAAVTALMSGGAPAAVGAATGAVIVAGAVAGTLAGPTAGPSPDGAAHGHGHVAATSSGVWEPGSSSLARVSAAAPSMGQRLPARSVVSLPGRPTLTHSTASAAPSTVSLPAVSPPPVSATVSAGPVSRPPVTATVSAGPIPLPPGTATVSLPPVSLPPVSVSPIPLPLPSTTLSLPPITLPTLDPSVTVSIPLPPLLP